MTTDALCALTFEPLPALAGWYGAHVETIGSTNREMGTLFAERGAALDQHWLTAGEQTEGRGRRDRKWSSPPGNLYASMCLDVSGMRTEALGILPLATGLAIHKALETLLPYSKSIALKWPNDVLIDGAKCCGILLERHVIKDATAAIIIGIGLNVKSHPDDTPYPATHLDAGGPKIALNTAFAALSSAMAETLSGIDRPDFAAMIRDAWRARAKGVGDAITVNLANGQLRGIFHDLDAGGRLVLRLDDNTTRTISAGDIFFA
ncbi:MAG: biotin--[acetyl-CoA-carboxylase] ligase [Pseudomonadota bacterium]